MVQFARAATPEELLAEEVDKERVVGDDVVVEDELLEVVLRVWPTKNARYAIPATNRTTTMAAAAFVFMLVMG